MLLALDQSEHCISMFCFAVLFSRRKYSVFGTDTSLLYLRNYKMLKFFQMMKKCREEIANMLNACNFSHYIIKSHMIV